MVIRVVRSLGRGGGVLVDLVDVGEANAHNRGEHTLNGEDDLSDTTEEPEKCINTKANHIIHEINEESHNTSKNSNASHDAATLLEHTTSRPTNEDTSPESNPDNTFNHDNSTDCPKKSVRDFEGKHIARHSRGAIGTAHDKIKAKIKFDLRDVSRNKDSLG